MQVTHNLWHAHHNSNMLASAYEDFKLYNPERQVHKKNK